MKRFRSNLERGVLKLEGVSTAKVVLFHQGGTELRRCENCVFFLPVNILTGVTRRLLGPHDTLPCVLISLFHYFRLFLHSVKAYLATVSAHVSAMLSSRKNSHLCYFFQLKRKVQALSMFLCSFSWLCQANNGLNGCQVYNEIMEMDHPPACKYA